MNSTELIEKLAWSRSKGTASLHLSWTQALTAFPELPGSKLETIAKALPSPTSAREFAVFLSREDDPAKALDSFLADIDESESFLEEWLEAFEVLSTHLRGTAHRPTLTHAAGYLHCCEAVIDTGARYETFPMAVQTMLETYGYEGSA